MDTNYFRKRSFINRSTSATTFPISSPSIPSSSTPTKVIQAIGNNEKAQVISYLKITGLRVGIILNLKHGKLEWQRIVL